jgi:hypothetical protein
LYKVQEKELQIKREQEQLLAELEKKKKIMEQLKDESRNV